MLPRVECCPWFLKHIYICNELFPIAGRHNFYINEYQTPYGKRSFQAKVTKSFSDGYTIETIIDGKPLRGVLFSNKPSSTSTGVDNFNR